MDAKKKARLEAAGYTVGDAADFLGLTAEESRLVDLHVALARLLRRTREKGDLTQDELAAKTGSSQSRVAKAESFGWGVSLDLRFRLLFAAGGSYADVQAELAKMSGDDKPARKVVNAKAAAATPNLKIGPKKRPSRPGATAR